MFSRLLRAAGAVAAISGAAAQAANAPPATSAAPACYVDAGSRHSPNVCDTAAAHNASTRFAFFFYTAVVAVLMIVLVRMNRQEAAARDVFVHDAEALRARAAAAAPGSAERASLEAEAKDVEAAAADWPRLQADEIALEGDSKPKTSWSVSGRQRNVNRAYDPNTAEKLADAKANAADERSALLQRHGEHAFDRARAAKPAFDDASLVLLAAIVLVLVPLAFYEGNTPCDAPLYRLCFTKSTPTYTCAFNTAGSCVVTPI